MSAQKSKPAMPPALLRAPSPGERQPSTTTSRWALRVHADRRGRDRSGRGPRPGLPVSTSAPSRREDFPLPGLASKARRRCAGRVLQEVGFGVHVRDLPVERWDADFRMRVYWGLSRHIGDPVPQNRNGHLIGHVIDIGTQVGEVDKRLHADQRSSSPSMSTSCDVVALFCLAPRCRAARAPIVSGVAVHDEMMRTRPDLCAALYGPIPMDRRGEVPAGGQGWYEMPLFHWHRGSFTGFAPVRQYVELVKRFAEAPKISPLLAEALDVFYDLCADPRFCLTIPFRPGDIQYLHNHVVFHAGTS